MRVHRQTKARPIDRHAEERPHLIPLPARPFDASEVVYRTVDAEGFVVYRQNFYAAPWRLIGQSVAVRVTEDELVIHDRAFVEAARHRLFPRSVAGQRSRCKDHEPPRDAQRRVGAARRSDSRSSARRARGSWRACSPATGSARTRPNASWRWRRPTRAPTSSAALERAVRYGAFSLGGHATHPRGAGPAQDAAGRAGRRPSDLVWTGSCDGEPTPPRPTSDYQALLGEGPHDAEATDPGADRPRAANRATRRRRPRACMRRHRRAADAGRRADPGGARRGAVGGGEGVAEPPGVPAPAAGRPGRGQAPAGAGATDPRREVPRADDPGGVRLGVQRQGSGPAEHRATGDLRLRAAARERDPGGSDRPGQEPDPPGGGPRRVCPGLPRAVRDQRQAAPGVHRGPGRRDLRPDARSDYARLDLLLIDEFGFDRLEREAQAQASTFYYRLLDARTGRRSTALATNIDFAAWADYLGDPPLATAFLDRLVDGAVILKLTGRSYRAHRARSVLETSRADPSRP